MTRQLRLHYGLNFLKIQSGGLSARYDSGGGWSGSGTNGARGGSLVGRVLLMTADANNQPIAASEKWAAWHGNSPQPK
jgi:hypothetical protein